MIPLHISGIVGIVLARAVEYHQIDRLMVQKTMKIKGITSNAQALFLALVVLTALMSGLF